METAKPILASISLDQKKRNCFNLHQQDIHSVWEKLGPNHSF